MTSYIMCNEFTFLVTVERHYWDHCWAKKIGFFWVPCIEQEIQFLYKASETGCPSGPKSLVRVQILEVHRVKVW